MRCKSSRRFFQSQLRPRSLARRRYNDVRRHPLEANKPTTPDESTTIVGPDSSNPCVAAE
jgi:hypothetical protein